MTTYEEALAERAAYTKEIERELGLEVWAGGLEMATNQWDISVEMRNGKSVTLYGADEARKFIDNWDPTPIDDGTARQNGPEVIGERCPWCGAVVLDKDHSRSHD
jgi:hypothetical protein